MPNGAMTLLEAKIRGRDGRPFSRHFQNVTPEQARKKISKQRLGKVMWVRKVNLWEIMGTIETMSLQDIISVKGETRRKTPTGDPLIDGTSLEEVLFPRRKQKRREERMRRD